VGKKGNHRTAGDLTGCPACIHQRFVGTDQLVFDLFNKEAKS